MNAQPRILVADDEENIRLILHESLRREGLFVVEAVDGVQAVELVQRENFDVVILDLRMPRMDGITALEKIRSLDPLLPVVMITAHGGRKTALEMVRLGGYDYFEKPFDMNELRVVVRRALERRQLHRQIEVLEAQLHQERSFANIVGESPPMKDVFDLVRRVAPTDATVLITGESGTGKELIADAIHNNSPRSNEPLLKVNCGAIPEALLESELFGHERGAFTGAIAMKPGKFELANKGTIFLDEIGEMPLALQVKILRVIQERKIERVGGTRTLTVDVRIVTATNRDLAREVEEKRFREDLFFRLEVVPIHLPPLRKRRSDIPLLISHFLRVYNTKMGKSFQGFTPEAMDLMQSHDWPGNIRELDNIVQRAMILSPGPWLGTETLPPDMRSGGYSSHLQSAEQKMALSFDPCDFSQPMSQQIERMMDEAEVHMIQVALRKCNNRRQETADLLGISRKSLHNKMLKHGLLEKDED